MNQWKTHKLECKSDDKDDVETTEIAAMISSLRQERVVYGISECYSLARFNQTHVFKDLNISLVFGSVGW
jgi:hypothetical protein